MATYYVDSNATGLNDGSSWTDAWTSIGSASSVSAGDIVLLASDHVENEAGSSITINYAYPSAQMARLISTNKSTGIAEAGALLNLTTTSNNSDIFIQGSVSIFGVTFRRNRYVYIGNDRASKVRFSSCTFDHNSFTAASNRQIQIGQGVQCSNHIVFDDCTIDNTNGNSYAYIDVYSNEQLVLNRTTITPHSSQSNIFVLGSDSFFVASIKISNCDFSSLSSYNLFSSWSGSRQHFVTIEKCNLPSSWLTASSYVPTTDRGSTVKFLECSANTPTTAMTGFNREDACNGQSFNSYTEYRSSGANDSTDDFSYEMTTNSSPLSAEDFIEAIPFTKYVESGSQTITVYIAGGTSLNDDDFWIEVESPSELASPTAQGKFRTTKPDPLATPTALTSDTSSWTGTGVGTAQKVEVAISPTIAGTVTVRCYLAKPSTTVYVDPKISTDGYQRVFSGVLVDGDAVGGGGAALHPLRSN